MISRITDGIKEFFRLEAAGGIVLFVAMVLGMACENSPLTNLYNRILETPVEFRVGGFGVAKPSFLWINDGLMAIFFLLVGLELKRELLEGELSDLRQVILPGVAALGGMLVPALIYAALNWNDPVAIRGWAIPAATDIAFVIGVLALLRDCVPLALRVFVVSLALFDDIGAIVIIALFYMRSLAIVPLAVALAITVLLFSLNRWRVLAKTPYILCGIVLWLAVLKSGIHATISGVVLAIFVPMTSGESAKDCPLRQLEHDLHPTVAFAVMPLFAFANSGISLLSISWSSFVASVPLGVAVGLFIGKQIGVFSFAWLAVRSGAVHLPDGVTWKALYGASLLCGIGFTMSLFIGSLAFSPDTVKESMDERVGIIAGSFLSGVAGYLVLKSALKRPAL